MNQVYLEDRTSRFIEEYKERKEAGAFASNAELAKVLGYKGASSITEILAGRQNITPDKYKLFRQKYFTDISVSEGQNVGDLGMETIKSLAESNRTLSEANKVLADAHKLIAKGNEELIQIIKISLGKQVSDVPVSQLPAVDTAGAVDELRRTGRTGSFERPKKDEQ